MRKAILFLCVVWAGAVVPVLGGIKENSEQILNSRFNGDGALHFFKIDLPAAVRDSAERAARQRFFSDYVYAWRVDRGDSTFYAVLDNVKGKSLPITFMVVFNGAGNVDLARVVKYREPVGGAVGNLSWLAQFIGKNALSGYSVGTDVDGISGATISVHAMSKGIQKLTHIFSYLQTELDKR